MIIPNSIRRILIVFDVTRPETTGTYVLRALERLKTNGDIDEVRHATPDNVSQLAGSTFDLVIVVDDGLDYPLPNGLGPVVYWTIDTHIGFQRSLVRSGQADYVFAAQKNATERLRQAGIATARWLPLACDPEIHGKQDVPKERDVCFVGNLFDGPRTNLVRLLQQYFPGMYIGNAYFEEMARIYSASRIVFNRSLADDLNMRVFEALASGSLLATNELTDGGLGDNGQGELFRDGVHLMTYRDGDELCDKTRYYIRHEDLRERIAAAGRAEVLAKHTYDHRVAEMLAAVSGHSSVATGNGPDISHDSRLDGCASMATALGVGQMTKDQGQVTSSHDHSYFGHARHDIASLVPLDAKTILEIGCGHGLTGALIKERQSSEWVGIEKDKEAAAVARTHNNQVFVGDLEQMDLPDWDDHFDVVILGDVVEHFIDPVAQLTRIQPWIKAGGLLIASIPNMRHHSVVAGLLAGNLTYEPAGLLDDTHRHFYCRRDIQKLFDQTGYTITSWSAVPGPGYEEWERAGRPGRVTLGNMTIEAPVEEIQEYFVYQWLVVAKSVQVAGSLGQAVPDMAESAELETQSVRQWSDEPSFLEAQSLIVTSDAQADVLSSPSLGLSSDFPLIIVLMVTFNRLEYTRPSLESVLAQDYPNFRLVVWDNASTDGTIEFLKERLKCEDRATLILSPVNRGVVAPMNEVWFGDHAEFPGTGGEELRAKIDNDTVVPPDLLRRLAECHQRSTRFGVLSGFHFRKEGEAIIDEGMVEVIDGVAVVRQQYVGGCAVMVKKSDLDRIGPIACRTDAQQGPFMDSGWTLYQERMVAAGMIHGYPVPLIHVEHLEDTRSPHCIRSADHQAYKQALRGMNLEQSTEALCVWRPHRMAPITECRASRTESEKPAPGPMTFTQDFRRDFDQLDFFGAPFAFSRFGDGERAICSGSAIKAQDGWSYPGGPSQFAADLNAALRFNDPGYYLGLSDACCDPASHEWYLRQITVPLSQVTFANIFVNGNYHRFRQLDLGACALVASSGGDYWVPENILETTFSLDKLVERLLSVKRPILVSAGPASCIIVHKYWRRARPDERQVIIDVGSALDELTKGRKTRQYQVPGTRNAELVCFW